MDWWAIAHGMIGAVMGGLGASFAWIGRQRRIDQKKPKPESFPDEIPCFHDWGSWEPCVITNNGDWTTHHGKRIYMRSSGHRRTCNVCGVPQIRTLRNLVIEQDEELEVKELDYE